MSTDQTPTSHRPPEPPLEELLKQSPYPTPLLKDPPICIIVGPDWEGTTVEMPGLKASLPAVLASLVHLASTAPTVEWEQTEEANP